MLCITREDAELLRTFTLSLKMKNHEKIAEHFKNKFEQDPGNIVNAFNYGMCMSIYIITDPNDSDKSKHLVGVNESFSLCLQHKPEWWLPRYLRSEINDGVPDEVVQESDSLQFSVLKKMNPQEDRRWLMEGQKACKQKPSYFLCPYIAQTRTYLRKGNPTEAIQCYREGLAALSIEKSPFSFPYLSRPFYDTILLFRKLDKTDEAEEIKKYGLTLFPKAKNLCMA